jgi:hypothetical protein
MGAARLGGQAMVSPGIIGSMTRWTTLSMVLSSLPNPAARKQAIDKALFDANREAQREYMSVREQFRRDAKSASIHRESDYRQRISSAQFMDDPLEKQHAKKMAGLTKTRQETEERFAKKQIKELEKSDKDWRTMMSRKDSRFLERVGEDLGNWGTGWKQWGQGLVHGAAKGIDTLTFGATGLASSEEDFAKRLGKKTQTFKLTSPEGQRIEDFRIDNEQTGSYIEVKNGVMTLKVIDDNETTDLLNQAQLEKSDQIIKTIEEASRKEQDRLHKIEEQQRKATEIAFRERQKDMNLQSLGTDYIIQQAQVDAVLNSPFASVEQKMMARIEQRRLARDYKIDQDYEEEKARTYSTDDDRKKLATERDTKLATSKTEVEQEYNEKMQHPGLTDTERRQLEAERDAKLSRVQSDINKEHDDALAQLPKYEVTDDDRQALDKERDDKLADLKAGFDTTGASQDVGDKVMAWMRETDWSGRRASARKGASTKQQDEIDQQYNEELRQKRKEFESQDPRYTEYEGKKRQIESDRVQAEKELADQGVKVGASPEQLTEKANVHAMRKAGSAMQAQQESMMLGTAMRSPVRSNLEESFNMINDELMRVGEAKRLGLDWQGSKDDGKDMGVAVGTMTAELEKHGKILEDQAKSLRHIRDALDPRGIPVRVQ